MNKKHVYSVAAQMLKRTVIVGGCKCIFAVIARSNFKAVAALKVQHYGKAI